MAKILTGIWASLISASVYAQTGPTNIGDIQDAAGKSPDDASRFILKQLFGQFGDNPMTATGAPDTLLGNVILMFNASAFIIAVFWLSYGLVKAVVATAHEGKVLGERMSPIWVPIRAVTGISTLLPVFGGFNAAQAIMMYAVILSVGIANLATDQFVAKLADYQGLVVMPSLPSNDGAGGETTVAQNLLATHVCLLAYKDYSDGQNSLGAAGESMTLQTSVGSVDGGKCGGASIPSSSRWRDGTRSSWGTGALLGFRVDSVNYSAIADQARTRLETTLSETDSRMAQLAQTWYDSYKTYLDGSGVKPVIVLDDIRKAAADAAAAARSGASSDSSGVDSAIASNVRGNMTKFGWLSVGAWFSTYSEVNAAIADANRTYALNSTAPGASHGVSGFLLDGNSALPNDVSDALNLLNQGFAKSTQGKNAAGSGWFDTETGNTSLGQTIVSKLIQATASGSGGGGGAFGGSNGSNGPYGALVNPVIAIKNLGDYLLILFDTIQIAKATESVSVGGGGVAGTALSIASKTILKPISALLETAGAAAAYIIPALFFVGAFFSIYIPMVPFMSWISAITGWVANVVEGILAATVWAFSHIDLDGDGMGRRTEKGYLHLVNVLFRPVLMVSGFVLASSAVVLLGTLFTAMFLPAMANAQGNSMTGIISILGLLGLYGTMMLTLIQTCFNWIYEVPDRVIGWAGSASQEKFGREMDGHVEGKANQMMRWGGRATTAGAVGGDV